MAGSARHDGRAVTDKVIAILRAFMHGSELSNVEVARLANLPVSTAHRLLRHLVVGGMLEKTPRREYRVGPTIRAIAASGRSEGANVASNYSLGDIARLGGMPVSTVHQPAEAVVDTGLPVLDFDFLGAGSPFPRNAKSADEGVTDGKPA